MTPRDIIIAARAKIATPKTWTQGVYARNARGREVHYGAKGAVRWCSTGAVRCVRDNPEAGVGIEDANVALDILCAAAMDESIAAFNDTHTHPAVLAMFDRAIAKADAP